MLKPVDDGAIARAQAWVADHYTASNCLKRMAALSGLPERTFKRWFRKPTGLTPLEYAQPLWIEEAKQVLETTDNAIDSIIDSIIEAIGYDDPASFRRLFKRLTGVTPGRYRQRYHEIRQRVN